jgi:hypothetical protein
MPKTSPKAMIPRTANLFLEEQVNMIDSERSKLLVGALEVEQKTTK